MSSRHNRMNSTQRRIQRTYVFERDKGRCYYCSTPVSYEDGALDHLTPLLYKNRVGVCINMKRNLVWSCKACDIVRSMVTHCIGQLILLEHTKNTKSREHIMQKEKYWISELGNNFIEWNF